MTYSEKLRDPKWQRKRLEIMSRDSFACQFCFDEKNTLNVHHKLYEWGRDPWDYPDTNFITLCEECRDQVEITKRAITLMLSDPYRFQDFFNLAKHLMNGPDDNISAYLTNYSNDGTYGPLCHKDS